MYGSITAIEVTWHAWSPTAACQHSTTRTLQLTFRLARTLPAISQDKSAYIHCVTCCRLATPSRARAQWQSLRRRSWTFFVRCLRIVRIVREIRVQFRKNDYNACRRSGERIPDDEAWQEIQLHPDEDLSGNKCRPTITRHSRLFNLAERYIVNRKLARIVSETLQQSRTTMRACDLFYLVDLTM